MEKSKYSFYERKKPVSFPRFLWINRNWDLVTVHKKVFNYLRFYFDFQLQNFKEFPEEAAFEKIFDDLNSENWSDKLADGENPGEYAYSLNIVNPEKKTYYNKGTEYFGMNNFENIPLPYDPEESFGDKIDKFFLEYENKDDSDDDMDYSYGMSKPSEPKEKSDVVKNNTNDGYYEENEYNSSAKNKVFELEIFWNKDRQQAAIQKLDRCKKHSNFAEISRAAEKVNSEEISLRH